MALAYHSGTRGDGRSPDVVGVSRILDPAMYSFLLSTVTPSPTFPILNNYMTSRNNEWFTDKLAHRLRKSMPSFPGSRGCRTPRMSVKDLAEMRDPPP